VKSENSGLPAGRTSFERFVKRTYTEPAENRRGERHRYLGGWLSLWRDFGDGVEYSGRHFETWLRLCLEIADAAMQGQISFNYRGTPEEDYQDKFARQIDGIDNRENPTYYDDRTRYEIAVTRWEHEGRGILADDWSGFRDIERLQDDSRPG
jgi:hypothetical protein